MPRIAGVTEGGSLLARVAFFFTKRKVGRVVTPVRIHALHTRLLQGYGQMEMAQDKAARVGVGIKSLAQILAAVRIGCPF